MRLYASVLALVGVALLPLACGGGTQQSQPQTPVPVASATGSATANVVATPATATGLAVAAAPADLVAVVRWKSPAATFATVQQWFNVPVPVDEVADELFHAPDMAGVLALDTPVDLAVALDPKASAQDPKPFFAFSVGLRSVDDARRALERRGPVQEVGAGIYRLNLGRHSDKLVCLLGPSLGSSQARIVCGPHERDAEALQPYLARGLSAEAPPASDIHAELNLAPIQRRYGSMLPSALQMGTSFLSREYGTGDRALDRAMTDAITGLSDETLALANDLDGMRIDLNVEPGTRVVSGDTTLRFKGRTSWIAQRMFERRDQIGVPPELYWSLPAASDAAFFNRGTDGSGYTGIRRVGGELIRTGLAKVDFPEADRAAVGALFDQLFQRMPVTVSASGHIDAPPAATARSGNDIERLRNQMVTSMGWQLFGLDEKSDRLDKWLRDVAATYNRPAVQAWIAKQAHVDRKTLPKVKYGAVTVAGLSGVKGLEVSLSVPAPAFDSEGNPRAADAKPSVFTYWLLVAADGSRSWLAMGADRASIDKHLAEVKAGAARTGTLASRPGFEALKSERMLTGGFISIAGITAQATGGLSSFLQGHGGNNHDFENVLNALAHMPNHGETPVVFFSLLRDGNPSEVTTRFRVSKGTIDDLTSLVGVLAGGGMVPPPPAPPRP